MASKAIKVLPAKFKKNKEKLNGIKPKKEIEKKLPKVVQTKSDKANKHIVFEDDNSEGVIAKNKTPKKSAQDRGNDIGKKWYEDYAKYNLDAELVELKETEIQELTNSCRTCYETEQTSFEKKNPSDAKWLKTALHKGTSKDRANAGALLVQSNPLANLETLETLIGFTKTTNKFSTDSVDVTTELFINSLLPPNRKLISLPLRGADWKAIKKDQVIDKATKDKLFAYWHFEAAIKDQYFEFLRNVQSAVQGNQDANKNQAIIYASKLLSYAPEKEQMLLSMLVNKLGDPSNKVAAKALHHLTEVSFRHPAMCGVIANETEKFLFRNNITEHAQHFALCFLAQLAPYGNIDVCTKLVNICFSFFKILVSKGSINSKTMQAILRCLKRAIVDVVKANNETPGTDGGFLSKDTQDTIYRLIHFADIQISLQTLALLLQIITVVNGEVKQDRFYNALYKKILDPSIGTCGPKWSALFLHIIHRAIHIDTNKARAQAFIRRLLQAALYFSPPIACGCLIVVDKVLKARSDLNKFSVPIASADKISNVAVENDDEDDDGDEYYKDAPENDERVNEETQIDNLKEKPEATKHGSWHHISQVDTIEEKKVKEITPSKYDPFNRVPAYAGAEFALQTELLALVHHFHPTVRVFAQNIIEHKHIKFYGDPLRDFSLTQFLDRFAFKNPKKSNENRPDSLVHATHHKPYTAYGSRGQPLKQLTNSNCTEDERFIFEFLDKKREREAAFGDRNEETREIDDDEFDAYLDSLGGKKSDDADEDDELNFLGDFADEFKDSDSQKVRKKNRNASEDDAANDWNSDSDGEDDGNETDGSLNENEFDDNSDDGSVSLDGDDDGDDSDIFEDDGSDSMQEIFDPEEGDEDDAAPKSKKMKSLSGKDFQRKLKNTDNIESLFAAAEDFSEMLEETSKSNKHGTLGEIFNQDKSSEKQLDWEQKRLKQRSGFKRKPKTKRNRSQGKKLRGEVNAKPVLGKRKK